jgi:hypothetical protein
VSRMTIAGGYLAPSVQSPPRIGTSFSHSP